MRARVKKYLPALLCALAPIVCYLIVRPYAETGIDDDWSYIRSAQVLAQSGHIVYNGWATAMLGWQLYFGALFIKLFGFSFTAVRLSTFVQAVATAFLLQRTLVRTGINEWNATLATLTFVLSPLYLPLSFTFMSDVAGLLCIVLCLYMCLRALEAETQRSAMIWISLAALLNAAAGTVRQIVWLGVLVMIPCTLWLLRRDRRVLLTGTISCIVGAGIVFAARHWFAHQPYSIPYPVIFEKIHLVSWIVHTAGTALRASGELSMFLLPVLLMFLEPLRKWNRRKILVFATGALCFAVLGIFLSVFVKLNQFLAPFFVSDEMYPAFQSLNLIPVPDTHIDLARDGVRLLLTGVTIIGFLAFITSLIGERESSPVPRPKAVPIKWQKLAVVLGPFTLAYLALLVPAAATGEVGFADRYLLPLLAFCLLVVTRYYQQKVRPRLPLACAVLIMVVAGISVVCTHDLFALYRGNAAAFHEIRSSGVPADAIWGPWEIDGWTQVEKAGYLNSNKIRVPTGAYVSLPPRAFPPNCNEDNPEFLDLAPAIKPVYGFSATPGDCYVPAKFPPVTYRTWIAPHIHSMYFFKLPVYLSR